MEMLRAFAVQWLEFYFLSLEVNFKIRWKLQGFNFQEEPMLFESHCIKKQANYVGEAALLVFKWKSIHSTLEISWSQGASVCI
uniref:Uncharacterized protein n=1 Tax=Salix viminalis TaxID=40686 RepID=A0A6N2LZV0_SALVM